MALRRVLRGAGRAAATAAAIALLSLTGASAQTSPYSDGFFGLIGETRPGQCNPELIAAIEQQMAQPRLTLPTSVRERSGRRRNRGDNREQTDAVETDGFARLLDYYKSMCPETEDALHVWVREPNTLANAVWEDVIGPIFSETLGRESEVTTYLPYYESALAVQRQRWAERYREYGAAPPPLPESHPVSRMARVVEQLGANIAQPLAIQLRLIEAGLTEAEYDMLSQLAIDAMYAESDNRSLVRQQVVCERTDTFESPAALGRAMDEIEAILRAEREQAVARLLGAIGLEAAEKVLQYAAAVAPDTVSRQNHEATYPRLDEAYREQLHYVACRGGEAPIWSYADLLNSETTRNEAILRKRR